MRHLYSLALAVLVGALATGVAATQDSQLERARRLLREAPVFDGHNDYPWQVRERVQGDLDLLDLRRPQPDLMTDFARLEAGGVGAQFWSVYVPSPDPAVDPATSVTQVLEQIDVVHRMVERYPTHLALARTAEDVDAARRNGRIASLIGVEGGHAINSSLGTLRMLYALGARYMTLTHSLNTPWADSATDTARLDGLSAFGEDVVREMNRLGMLVDLSHVSPATMADVLDVASAPVIFSHSSARALTDVPRNVPDDILRRLPANGGVVMVTFVPGFVSQAVADQGASQATGPPPRATLAQVADHIDHIRQVAGIDHIGIGSDFDGITSVPRGLEDVSTFPALLVELLNRGYSDEDVRKITFGNIMRALRAAEAAAGR